jgi:hypothetical protein
MSGFFCILSLRNRLTSANTGQPIHPVVIQQKNGKSTLRRRRSVLLVRHDPHPVESNRMTCLSCASKISTLSGKNTGCLVNVSILDCKFLFFLQAEKLIAQSTSEVRRINIDSLFIHIVCRLNAPSFLKTWVMLYLKKSSVIWS